jgi:hypothetical protein
MRETGVFWRRRQRPLQIITLVLLTGEGGKGDEVKV